MLKLYYKPTCPFCRKVLDEAELLGIKFELKDISSSDEIAAELIEKGGMRQVPYLVDEERNVSMYESDDIVEYLREHYAPQSDEPEEKTEEVKIHKAGGTCGSV